MKHLLPILVFLTALGSSCEVSPFSVASTQVIFVDGTTADASLQTSLAIVIAVPLTNCAACSPVTNCLGSVTVTNNPTPAPFNLTAIATNTSITLHWQNPPGLMSNLVLRAPKTILAVLVNGETSYTDTGLHPSPTNTYAIVGMSADIFGVFSTLTPTNPMVGLVAPTGLTTTSPAPGSLTVNWQSTGTQQGFWTRWATNSTGPWNMTATLAPNVFTYTFGPLKQ